MHAPGLTALVLAALLLVPLAQAGGDLTLPGMHLVVEDSRGMECEQPVGGFCVFGVEEGSGPGDTTLDVYQSIHALLIEADGDEVIPGEADLLPDATLVLAADAIYLRHPVYHVLGDAAALVPRYPGYDDYHFRSDAEAVGLDYYGPSLGDLDGAWRHGVLGFNHSGDNYEQLGPYNAPRGGETDTNVKGLHILLCGWGVTPPECRAYANQTSDAIVGATPNVRAGVAVYDVAVATANGTLSARLESGSTLPLTLGKRASAPSAPPARPATALPDAAVPAPAPSTDAPTRKSDAPRDPPTVTLAGAAPTRLTSDPAARAYVLLASAGVAFGILLAALYSRLARAGILDQDTRGRVHARVLAAPGSSLISIARDLGLGATTTRHHVTVLRKHGLVRAQRVGRETLVFPIAAPEGPLALAALVRGAARRKVALALVSGAGTQRAIQDATGLSQRLVSYHLERLRAAGLAQDAGGWPRTYAATQALRAALPAPPTGSRVQGATS